MRAVCPTVYRYLCLLLIAFALAGTSEAGSKKIFTLEDPRGDDTGDGTLSYPVTSAIGRGDLDLVQLSAKRVRGGTRFEAVFARPVKIAGPEPIDDVGTRLNSVARRGIYTFNLDIYIDTDRIEGSGNTNALPGRRADIDPAHAWEKVICLTPRPAEASRILGDILRRNARLAEIDAGKKIDREDVRRLKLEIAADLSNYVFFPTKIDVYGPKVKFFVPNEFLKGPAKDTWSYIVAVSASNLYQSLNISARREENRLNSLMILGVEHGRSPDALGTEHQPASFVPPLVDILVPAGRSQGEVLNSYDVKLQQFVTLPGIVPAEGS